MDQLNNWKSILEMKEKILLDSGSSEEVKLRVPENLMRLLIEDKRKLEDIKIKMSLNKLYIFALMIALNYGQNEDGSFYRVRNKRNLDDYISDVFTDTRKRKKNGNGVK